MNNFLSLSLAVMAQRPTPPVPPKMGIGITPPVGDVPLDGNIWVLLCFALLIGGYTIYRNRKRAL